MTMFDACDYIDNETFEKYSVDSLDCSEYKDAFTSPVLSAKTSHAILNEPFRLHAEGELNSNFWNCEIDQSALIEKGLQLNDDGSFSKSPRHNESLPFVMPAEKVAQIRQRKQKCKRLTEELKIKTNERKPNRSVDSKTDPIGSSFSSNFIPARNPRHSNGNLTDSMKEALFRENVKEQSFLPRLLKPEQRARQECRQNARNPKKNQSDLQLPNIQKPKLSYFERYQMKNGFDPRSISLKGLKSVSETARSNFGDSSADLLSEVSSRFVSPGVDDSEESFYQKLMAGGKKSSSKVSSGRSSDHKPKVSKSVDRAKEIKIESPGSNPLKVSPMSIKIATVMTSRSSRKMQHLCGNNPGIVPKAELLSKARAYGNQANIRNIVKQQIKMQSAKLRRDAISGYIAGNDEENSRDADEGKPHAFLPPLMECKREVRSMQNKSAYEELSRLDKKTSDFSSQISFLTSMRSSAKV